MTSREMLIVVGAILLGILFVPMVGSLAPIAILLLVLLVLLNFARERWPR